MKQQIPELQRKLHQLLKDLLKVESKEALDKIQDFTALHENDPYYPNIAEVLRTQTAYFLSESGKHQEAMAVYQTLLEEELQQEDPKEFSIGVNYLCIIKELIHMGNKGQAKDLAINILHEYEFDWGLNMSILHDISDSLESLEPFEDKILKIERELEIDTPPALDLKEKLKLLKEENQRANRAYTRITLGNYTALELIEKLKEFATREPVGFYRKLAERHLDSFK